MTSMTRTRTWRGAGDSEYIQALKDHVLTWRGRLDVSSDAQTFFYKYTRTLLRDGASFGQRPGRSRFRGTTVSTGLRADFSLQPASTPAGPHPESLDRALQHRLQVVDGSLAAYTSRSIWASQAHLARRYWSNHCDDNEILFVVSGKPVRIIRCVPEHFLHEITRHGIVLQKGSHPAQARLGRIAVLACAAAASGATAASGAAMKGDDADQFFPVGFRWPAAAK